MIISTAKKQTHLMHRELIAGVNLLHDGIGRHSIHILHNEMTELAAVALESMGRLDIDTVNQLRRQCPEFFAFEISESENVLQTKPEWTEKLIAGDGVLLHITANMTPYKLNGALVGAIEWWKEKSPSGIYIDTLESTKATKIFIHR